MRAHLACAREHETRPSGRQQSLHPASLPRLRAAIWQRACAPTPCSRARGAAFLPSAELAPLPAALALCPMAACMCTLLELVSARHGVPATGGASATPAPAEQARCPMAACVRISLVLVSTRGGLLAVGSAETRPAACRVCLALGLVSTRCGPPAVGGAGIAPAACRAWAPPDGSSRAHLARAREHETWTYGRQRGWHHVSCPPSKHAARWHYECAPCSCSCPDRLAVARPPWRLSQTGMGGWEFESGIAPRSTDAHVNRAAILCDVGRVTLIVYYVHYSTVQ